MAEAQKNGRESRSLCVKGDKELAKKIHVRPGKSQSKVGFVVGIVFCLIGLFVVIPTFGLFGILWTAAAGWIAYTHYRNGFTDKHIASRVIEIEENGEAEEDVEERLQKLQSLYDKALITRDEYEQKRKEILSDL